MSIRRPGLEAEAFAIVKHMKIGNYPDTGDFSEASNEPTDFRLVIWKNLLENSRDMVGALRKLNLDYASRSTKVRRYPYTFIFVRFY
jgi:hypothetical protein